MSFRAVLGVVGVAVATGLPCPAAANAQETGDGPYTQAQAERGRRIFGAFCATCHGVDLEGGVGPALTGPAFSAKWSGQDRSVQDLYVGSSPRR
jgi:mono/diheme cytochrome c family protein